MFEIGGVEAEISQMKNDGQIPRKLSRFVGAQILKYLELVQVICEYRFRYMSMFTE